MIKAEPTIANVDITLANTEYSYTLPVGTNKFTIKLRDAGVNMQVCFVSAQSNTVYITLPGGKSYTENKIKGSPNVLYFRSSTANQVAEILTYK